MEAVLDVVAGTGVVLLLLAAASVDRRWVRGLAVAAVAAAVYALHPLAVRQSLTAFVGGLDGAGVQTLAALLAFDGALGCGGVALLLGAQHGRRLRWFERLAAHHVGVIPAPALFYVEVKAFHAASGMDLLDDGAGAVPRRRRRGHGRKRGHPAAASRPGSPGRAAPARARGPGGAGDRTDRVRAAGGRAEHGGGGRGRTPRRRRRLGGPARRLLEPSPAPTRGAWDDDRNAGRYSACRRPPSVRTCPEPWSC